MTAQVHGQLPVRRNEPGQEVKYEDRRGGGRGMHEEWRRAARGGSLLRPQDERMPDSLVYG